MVAGRRENTILLLFFACQVYNYVPLILKINQLVRSRLCAERREKALHFPVYSRIINIAFSPLILWSLPEKRGTTIVQYTSTSLRDRIFIASPYERTDRPPPLRLLYTQSRHLLINCCSPINHHHHHRFHSLSRSLHCAFYTTHPRQQRAYPKELN